MYGAEAPEAPAISATWRPSPPDPARVRVYDAEKLEMLLAPAPHLGRATGSRSGMESAMRQSARSEKKREAREAEEQRVRRFERHREDANKRQNETERMVRERILDATAKRERRFNELRSDISEGHALADEIGKHLTLHEMNQRTKHKRQFDEWNSGVYGVIQDQINEQLDAMDSGDINRRRRAEYQKFLDTTNAKGAIFRDIIIESEYDPLEPNRNCLKVRTDHIRDPVKRVLDKHHEETSMLDDGDGDNAKPRRRPGRPLAHTREMLETTSWGAGKIEATPHGYFARLMDDDKKKPAADGKVSKTFSSKIPFDHYNVARGTEATKSEFPVGKRTTGGPKSTFTIS